MADTLGVGAAVEVNGVNYGALDAVQAPAPGTFSSPKAMPSSSVTATVGTLWLLVAVEVALLVIVGHLLRGRHGG